MWGSYTRLKAAAKNFLKEVGAAGGGRGRPGAAGITPAQTPDRWQHYPGMNPSIVFPVRCLRSIPARMSSSD